MKIWITNILFLSVLSVGLSACMKTPQLDTDFGPEFTANQLNQTLGHAEDMATKSTVQNIKTGEFAYFEKTNQIENMPTVIIRQRADTVTNIASDTQKTKLIYTITHQLGELDQASGNMKTSQSQSSACLEKVAGACNSAISATSTFNVPNLMNPLATLKSLSTDPSPTYGAFNGHFSDLSWKAIAQQAAAADSSGIKWTYHKLNVTETTAPQPSLLDLRKDTGCGGRTNPCGSLMHAYQVTFDEVDWSSEKYPVKYSYRLVFSDESPYFAAQLMSCGSTTIPFQTQRIFIEQCEYAKDFTVGHD